MTVYCKFCNRPCVNNTGLSKHTSSCTENPDRVELIAWNRGLTKYSDVRLANHARSVSNTVRGRTRTLETKQKLSAIAKSRGLGGYNPKGGRGKKGWYKGFYCDSSWELAFVIYHLDHKVDISRCTEVRQYVWNDAVRNYHPDFVVNNEVIEIKGYNSTQWEAKHAANGDVRVLFYEDLKPILNYVINTYGKNFIELYQSGE